MLLACVAGTLTMAVAGLSAAPAAMAYHYHEYCFNEATEGTGCPPKGSSTWQHLDENFAQGLRGGGVCIDAYLDPNNNGHYTTQKCGVSVSQPYGTEWGYPRAWTESYTQIVEGIEYYP
jgi:hypothetical protein